MEASVGEHFNALKGRWLIQTKCMRHNFMFLAPGPQKWSRTRESHQCTKSLVVFNCSGAPIDMDCQLEWSICFILWSVAFFIFCLELAKQIKVWQKLINNSQMHTICNLILWTTLCVRLLNALRISTTSKHRPLFGFSSFVCHQIGRGLGLSQNLLVQNLWTRLRSCTCVYIHQK